jgi:hypothetical protein
MIIRTYLYGYIAGFEILIPSGTSLNSVEDGEMDDHLKIVMQNDDSFNL